MRWDNLRLIEDVPADGALPLFARGAVVRRFDTPEFRGITFYEIQARSALNRVPEASYVPFRWTVNPYRGCSHACTYCATGDTPVLMGDGRTKPLADVRAGDAVYGTVRDGSYRCLVITGVLDHWSTSRLAYRVTLEDGTSLVVSGDHRLLTDRGWKYVTGSTSGSSQRPYLSVDDKLMGTGAVAEQPKDSAAYRRGYHRGISRLRGGLREVLRLFQIVNPVIARKRAIAGLAIKSPARLRVTSVEPLGVELPMYDITTGTGDFIANGVVSHNCFARRTHEYLDLDSGHDFDTQIVVKVNVGERLRIDLARPSWRREHVALGTNVDPYQRAEGRYRLMPEIIRALADASTPFSILTKGTLILRDLELLAAAAERVDVGTAFSVGFVDEKLWRSVEPGTPSPARRLAACRTLNEAGLRSGVLMAPILPYLADTDESLDQTIAAIAAAGATSVTPIVLHLRPGAREWYGSWLQNNHPELVSRYAELYGGRSYAPKAYQQEITAKVRALAAKHGVGRDDGRYFRRVHDSPAEPGAEPVADQLTLL